MKNTQQQIDELKKKKKNREILTIESGIKLRAPGGSLAIPLLPRVEASGFLIKPGSEEEARKGKEDENASLTAPTPQFAIKLPNLIS